MKSLALKAKTFSIFVAMEYYRSGSHWGRHLWARGYFVASSGNITDEVILEYIKNQDKEGTDDNFQIGRE